MKLGRRSYVKGIVGGLAIGTSFLMLSRNSFSASKITNPSQSKEEELSDDPNKHWGFLIDLSKCNGCVDLQPPEGDPTKELPRCTYSCRLHHNYLNSNPPQYWINVHRLTNNASGGEYFFPKPCQNCENPPCERVCPTGATYIRKDGTVSINNEICIGCRICMAACPYEARFFWWNEPSDKDTNTNSLCADPSIKGTVSKCDLCPILTYNNQLPACISACARGALYFGDFNEDAVSNRFETLVLSKTLEKYGGYQYKELENTKPSVFYLPSVSHSEIRMDSNAKIELDVNDSIMDYNTLYIKLMAHSSNSENPLISKDVTFKIKAESIIKIIATGKTNKEGFFAFNYKKEFKNKKIKIIAEIVDETQSNPIVVTVSHV